MVNKIKKRDGRIVDFDKYRIFNAIAKANMAVNYELTDNDILMITDEVVSQIDETNNSVEQIQDLVEEALIKHNFKKVAKEYIIYRENHNKIRNQESFLMDIYKKITSTNIEENDILRENANIDGSASMGTMLKYGSEGSKYFINNYVLPKDIAFAHQNGDIHQHDLDFFMLTETCCQIELDKLFKNGFNTGHGTVRPPQSIECASALTCIVIQSNQNEMHGGQSIPSLDYYLAPYVRLTYKKELIEICKNYLIIKYNCDKELVINIINQIFKDYDFRLPEDKEFKYPTDGYILNGITMHLRYDVFNSMFDYSISKALENTDKRTHQAMESLIHNLCMLNSRSGGQVPFSSVNYGLDTSPEGRMIIKNILRATEEGLGLGETPIFPVQVFKLKSGVNYNKEDPNYDLFRYAMVVSSKRLFPNFLSIDSSFNLPYYEKDKPNSHVATMGAVSQGYVKLYLPNHPIQYCTIEISYLYTFLKKFNLCSDLLTFDSHTKYVNVNSDEVFIKDSLAKTNTNYVKLKKWMVFDNPGNNWYKLQVSGYENYFTDDHPLYIYDGSNIINGTKRELIKNITIDDEVFISDEDNDIFLFKINSLEKINDKLIGYDVETESDRFDIYVKDEGDNFSLIGINSGNCRTRVMGNVYDPTREITGSRGNLSFTTINLPRLGILANKDINKFFTLLDEKIDLCFRQLLFRLSIQKKRKAKNYPFLMLNGIWIDSEKLNPDDEVGDVLNHGTLSVGFIGLAETLIALTGKHHGESGEAQELGLKIVKHMRDRCDQKSQEMKLNFTLLAAPAEGLSGRFVELDKKKFGIIPGVTDKDYYTNSSHVMVSYPISAFKKIEIEAPYHKYCNAGAISYIETDGNLSKNIDAFEKLVRYAVENDIGYFAVNHPVDRDPVCGYTGVINDVCPRCGRREGEGIPLSKLKELARKYPNVPLPKNIDSHSKLSESTEKEYFERVKEAISAFSKNPPEWWNIPYQGDGSL